MISSTCQDLLHFIDQSPTPYHAVESARARLLSAGFQPLSESEDFRALTKGAYFFQRGDSALIAFVLPSDKNIKAFRIIGTHTDSPNLRIKPNGLYQKENYLQLGIEVYGGVLLNSWLDRDLSIAGRAMVKSSHGPKTQLLRIDQPLLRIPQLAIHLDREVNEKGLILNRQEHLNPILGLSSKSSSTIPSPSSVEDLCISTLGISKTDFLGCDLMLYDTNPSSVGGLNQEFIFAPRLDNLSMCHAAITALVQAKPNLEEGIVPVIALFDHEEVGSQSAYGAGTPLLPMLLERLVLAKQGSKEDYFRALANSFCVSADTAHAVHPNYVERHDARHKPNINGGPVIKVNHQQRYATSTSTMVLFQELCQKNEVPVQFYSHRSDLPCGSTIGPITATLLGIPTVDIGSAILSMHSIRETGGSKDPDLIVPPLADFLCHLSL